MMCISYKSTIVCTAMILLSATGLNAQQPEFIIPTTNPAALVRQTVASTTIEVSYHRPSVRDRIIFGGLVPYDQVWRTGADAATSIAFSTHVDFGGTRVDSGTYELFTIPGKEVWTVILQKQRGQWGSYTYDAQYDVARVNVIPVVLKEQVESFTISFDDVSSNAAILNISWEWVRVPVHIHIDLRETVIPRLEEALQAEGRRPYFHAAMFYFENDLNIDRAEELMRLALEQNPDHIGMLYRLALILERKGDIAGAKTAAERSLTGAESAGSELKTEYQRLNSILLERLNRY